jgi:hypothetical protein
MLTSKEQSSDKKELETLLTNKQKALNSLKKINYKDEYKNETRKKKGSKDTYVAQVLKKPSEFRLFLDSIGISNTAKNEIIKKVKASDSDLKNDIVLIEALISIK